MPNNFGGSQYHPDYNPSTRLEKNESMKDGVCYTAIKRKGIWVFLAEDVSGNTWVEDEPPTPKLKRFVKQNP